MVIWREGGDVDGDGRGNGGRVHEDVGGEFFDDQYALELSITYEKSRRPPIAYANVKILRPENLALIWKSNHSSLIKAVWKNLWTGCGKIWPEQKFVIQEINPSTNLATVGRKQASIKDSRFRISAKFSRRSSLTSLGASISHQSVA